MFTVVCTAYDKVVLDAGSVDLLFICVFPVFWQFVTATELQVLDNKGSWCRRSDSLVKRLRGKLVNGYFVRCYLSGAQRHTVLWRTTSVIMQNGHPSKHEGTWQININSPRKRFSACHGRRLCFPFVYVEETSVSLLDAISDIIWQGGLSLITFDLSAAVSYWNSQGLQLSVRVCVGGAATYKWKLCIKNNNCYGIYEVFNNIVLDCIILMYCLSVCLWVKNHIV